MLFEEDRRAVTLTNQGQKIFGFLHLPRTVQMVPGVIICHGYAGTKIGRFRLYVRLAEALAKRGIACLRIDFRGCGDSEGAFIETTLESQISDTLVGLQFLSEMPQIDLSRIGIFGRSMGGVVAVCAANRYRRAKSLALWCPVFSGKPWQHEWQRAKHADIQGIQTIQFHGQIANQELFRQIFSLNMEQEMKGLGHIPLLHVHSERDELIPVEQADAFQRCRKSGDAFSQFVRLQHSDHEFSDHGEQGFSIELTTRWFQETLAPTPISATIRG